MDDYAETFDGREQEMLLKPFRGRRKLNLKRTAGLIEKLSSPRSKIQTYLADYEQTNDSGNGMETDRTLERKQML